MCRQKVIGLAALPTGYFTVLERTPNKWHALTGARAYATQHGVPVIVLAMPLAVALDEVPSRSPGEITVWPDPDGRGCWRVDHISASDASAAIVGSAFSFREAVAIARNAAQRLGATFDYSSPNFGGAA